jgi:hypothetical protein
MEEEAPAACRKYFSNVETFRFENPVVFQTAGDLVSYWRSHNLFREAADHKFGEIAAERIARAGEFTNKKRGIGVLAKGPLRTRPPS